MIWFLKVAKESNLYDFLVETVSYSWFPWFLGLVLFTIMITGINIGKIKVRSVIDIIRGKNKDFHRAFEILKKERSELESELDNVNKENKEMKLVLQFAQKPDFFQEVEKGMYVAYHVAKKPYIKVWSDGLNSKEHSEAIDALERLWEDEDEILIFGENPNVPSDLLYVIETKISKIGNLTIHCMEEQSKLFKNYFNEKSFPGVRIRVRD